MRGVMWKGRETSSTKPNVFEVWVAVNHLCRCEIVSLTTVHWHEWCFTPKHPFRGSVICFPSGRVKVVQNSTSEVTGMCVCTCISVFVLTVFRLIPSLCDVVLSSLQRAVWELRFGFRVDLRIRFVPQMCKYAVVNDYKTKPTHTSSNKLSTQGGDKGFHHHSSSCINMVSVEECVVLQANYCTEGRKNHFIIFNYIHVWR